MLRQFYISLQRYYYSGLNMVEIVSGGLNYAGQDMIVESQACAALGCGRTYTDPREAVAAAYKVAKQWKHELRVKRGLTKAQRKVHLSLGSNGGISLEFEPMSLQECQQKADEIYEQLPKCDYCASLLGDEYYTDYERIGDSKFCSENCALQTHLADIREIAIASVQQQVRDDHRTHGEGEWSCKLYEDGHIVKFKPNVGETMTWEVDPKTYEIKDDA